ncbi:ATP-binding protein [Actinokineospora soli]|uniref:ATP-binding protein n=1 Tax=Actinokineospora soli TaxID=1048753 RepID=A0ABW2TSS9_9PSEU
MLVAGEAGIGKTTLVTTAADEARRHGALVLSGSCWDSDSVPGLWPWVQVVRGLRRAASADEWAGVEAAAGSALAVLLGERPAEEAEFPLFDAVTSALVAVSQDRPVVVVLDDLHWADAASVKLLAFAAQHAWFERLLLIGTYRDVDVEGTGHPLEPLILPLVSKATVLTLTGLSEDEVGDLIALTGVDRPDPALVAEVHRRTGGNPFFVEQTARLWHGTGALAVPPGSATPSSAGWTRCPAAPARCSSAPPRSAASSTSRCWPPPPGATGSSGRSAGPSPPGSSPRSSPAGTPSSTTSCGRPWRRPTTPSAGPRTPPSPGPSTPTRTSPTPSSPPTAPGTRTPRSRTTRPSGPSTCWSPPPATRAAGSRRRRRPRTCAGPRPWPNPSAACSSSPSSASPSCTATRANAPGCTCARRPASPSGWSQPGRWCGSRSPCTSTARPARPRSPRASCGKPTAG